MIFTFDPPETGWTYNTLCSIVANPTAPSQPNSLHIIYSLAQTAACFRTLSGLVVGQDYDVWVRVNFDAESTGGVAVRIEYNDNPAQFRATMQRYYDEETGTMPELGWELRYLGVLHYTYPDRVLRITCFGSINALATVELDTIYIGTIPEVPISEADMAKKWEAIDAATAVLRGINGVGFNTNLEGRAYERLFLPTEEPSAVLPYACLPLDQESETINYEAMHFESSWTLTGYAFFPDNIESDKFNSAGARAAAKFADDLIAAFMADQSLGGTVHTGGVTKIDTFAGSEGDPTTWVVFTIEFGRIAGAIDLSA